MKQGNDLINQAVQETVQSSSSSPTEAGQADAAANKESLIDAINQTFTLFQLNYHNQFFSAFPSPADQDYTKKLWFESLAKFTPEQIMLGAKAAIEECEYLPNLHRMIELCRAQGPGGTLPSARDAYIEACNAPSPKAAFSWSHPAVYHAALESGWYLLMNEPERKAFPVYEKKYRDICQRVLSGEELTIEAPKQLEEQKGTPLSKEDGRKKAALLKEILFK